MKNYTNRIDRVAFFVAFLIFATTLWMTTIAYGPMPFWDSWATILLEDSWGNLWSLHNEHLIAFPKLFYGLDTLLANGTGLISIASIWGFQLAACLALASLANFNRLSALTLCIAALFWSRHLENLSWAFQVGFIGLGFVAVFSMWALSREGLRWQVIGFLFGATAPLWSLNGFLVPLAGSLFALVLRKNKLSLLFIASIIINLALYKVFGYGENSVVKQFRLLTVLSVYFSILVDPLIDLFFTKDAGWNRAVIYISWILGVGAHIAFLILATVGIRTKDTKLLALLGVAIFGFGSCAMAAIGRHEGYSGPAYRYAVFSVLAGLPLILGALQYLHITLARQIIVMVFCLLILINAKQWYQFAINRGEIESTAIYLIKQNPSSLEGYRLLYPAPEGIAETIRKHRERGLSIF